MDNVRVTVWLSTYNQAPYVAQALDSVLIQKTNFFYEVIAADDCSTDDTQKIILEYQKKHPEKIIPFFTSHNVGGCRKLIDCIDAGLFRGDYLAFLEGDDFWIDDNRLQKLVDFLEANPKYSRVAHQRVLVDEDGIAFGPDISPTLLEREFTIADFLQGRDYSDFGSVFRNYFKTAGNRYHKLLLASRNVCDFQDMFITQDFGPVYLKKECYGAYRCRRSASATNYNTITTAGYRSKDHIHICRAVELFYEGKYDLSPFINRCKRQILRSAVESCSSTELQDARNYLSASEINVFLPEIFYRSVRQKKKNELAFISRAFLPVEKKLLLLRCGLMMYRRLFRRKSFQQNESVRGYITSQNTVMK